MIFSQQLKSWFAKFQKYKVSYKNGFFQLYNLANSPYTIIESFDNMPFCKHFREKKLVTSRTLFLDTRLYYSELEEGLWIFVSDLELKKNVVLHNIYDESLPVNFNYINLHYSKKAVNSKSILVNGMVFTDKMWSIFKAGDAKAAYHFKGTNEFNITIYFTNEWLSQQLKSKTYFRDSNLHKFFQSDNTYLFLPDMDLSSDQFYHDFLNLIKQNGDNGKNKEIKELINDFFKHFIDKYDLEKMNDQYFKLSDRDRKYIQKAEKYLLDNLLHSFPGIENIAKKVGVSPTKLKSNFKIVHNQSLYHYYRYHQMHLASKLLSEKASTVKEVANLLGYENASKFAAVFKEQFGVQPSSLIKELTI
jgi:AraC-like DNA-binding protein